jgi:predicted outer membrane repeat protein
MKLCKQILFVSVLLATGGGMAVAQTQITISPANGIVFVNKNVQGGSGDGSSWNNACPSLAVALVAAKIGPGGTSKTNGSVTVLAPSGTVSEIRVAKGIYQPEYPADFADASTPSTDPSDNAFVLVPGVKVYGGFDPTLTGTDGSVEGRAIIIGADDFPIMRDTTVLSGVLDNGSACYHVVVSSGEMTVDGRDACLDGFTVAGGKADYDYGSDLTVNGNSVPHSYGGGIYNVGSSSAVCSPKYKKMVIENNEASTGDYGGGGGIYNSNSSPKLDNVLIKRNEATLGGGIYNNGRCSDTLTNVYIIGNTAGYIYGYGYGYGGGIYNDGNISSILTGVLIKDNEATYIGGGIYNNSSASPKLKNVIIENNKSGYYGGGIYTSGKDTLSNVQIIGNMALVEGGGIYNSGGDPVIDSVLIKRNVADVGSGGGIFAILGSFKLTKAFIENNKANTGGGGGIYNDDSNFSLTNAYIRGNMALEGGGIYNYSNRRDTLTNVQITGNTAGDYGGGMVGYNNNTMINVTIAGNYAKNDYGGIVFSGATDKRQVHNSIIYGNNSEGSNKNVSHTDEIIYANTLVGDATILVGGIVTNAGIISSADPLFTAPDYSTSVSDTTTGGDYSLRTCSPAINAGDNGWLPAGVNTDLADNPRIRKATVDLGVFETDETSCCNIEPDANGRVYVKKGVNGNGSSWDKAYPSLSGALGAAKTGATTGIPLTVCSPIKEIWVAKGIYCPEYRADFAEASPVSSSDSDNAFVLVPGVKVYGGFDPTLTGTDGSVEGRAVIIGADDFPIMRDTTVLSGVLDNGSVCYHVVVSSGEMTVDGRDACLDGFTVAGGKADGYYSSDLTVNGNSIQPLLGGGIYNIGSSSAVCSPKYKKMVIENNEAKIYGYGGGIYDSNSSPRLDSVLIKGNAADVGGGGIYNNGRCSDTLTNVYIIGNTAGYYNNNNNYYSYGYGGGIYNDGNISSILTGVLIKDNEATYIGGGIYNNNSASPKLKNVIIENNKSGYYGGGISNETANLRLDNVLIKGNEATYIGGGIYTSGKDTLSNVQIIGNTASHGGGIYNSGGDPVIDSVLIKGNIADSEGGGIFAILGSFKLTKAFIENNKANTDGGGIYNDDSNFSLTNAYIRGNMAIGYGGGIYNYSNRRDTLTNVQITGNTAGDCGGGMVGYNNNTMINVTIAGNYAKNDYGGIVFSGTTDRRQVHNSIIYGNNSEGDSKNVNNTAASIYANTLVGDAATNAGIILSADPRFKAPAYSTSVSDTTTGGDYSLKACGPAINAGDNSWLPAGVNTDLAGNPRIHDATVDPGAFETDGTSSLPIAPDGADVTTCYDGVAHSANATPNGSDEEIVWYDSETGTTETSAPTRTEPGTTTAYAASKDKSTDCESAARTAVSVTITPSPSYPDIRVRVCSDMSGDIDLSKYIDTVDVKVTVKWSSRISGLVTEDGAVSKNRLPLLGTLTLMYTVSGGCVPTAQQRTAYVEVLKNKRSHMLRDSIVICHENAGALQLNQLFGIEADGEWLFDNGGTPEPLDASAVKDYVGISSKGAVILNGCELYKKMTGIPTVTWSSGVKSKSVAIIYKANVTGCLKGEKFTVKIILTEE